MKLTYICSPCRGDYEKNIIKAQEYCRKAMNDGLLPIAPHVYFTQFVDDTNPEERKLGLRCGLQLLRYGGWQEPQRGYGGSYQHRSDRSLRTRRNDCEQPEKRQLYVERGRVI